MVNLSLLPHVSRFAFLSLSFCFFRHFGNDDNLYYLMVALDVDGVYMPGFLVDALSLHFKQTHRLADGFIVTLIQISISIYFFIDFNCVFRSTSQQQLFFSHSADATCAFAFSSSLTS